MNFSNLIQIICEGEMVVREFNDDDTYDYIDRFDRELSEIVGGFANGAVNVSWKVIPAARLKRIWMDYGKVGFVRDEKGLDNIADRMLNNIVRLDVCTALGGHSQRDPKDMIEEAGYEDEINLDDPDTADRFYWHYLTNDKGMDMISDFGLPKLQKLWPSIRRADSVEERLTFIDQALNVVHQRNDLAAMFVQGGTKTLVEIENQ